MANSLIKNIYTLVGYMPEVGDINLIDFKTEEECTEAFLKSKTI